MKKLLALLLAVGVTASVVQAQEVLSQNAVGYVKQEIEGGKLYLVSNPFDSIDSVDGTHELTEMLDVVPPGTVVSVWDSSAQGYNNFSKDGFGDWDPNAQTTTLARAQAMFLRLPGGGTTNELFLMGEVPDTEDTLQSRVPGITFVGYPYPASESFTDTEMAQNLPALTVVSRWDSDSQAYVNFSKDGFGDWDPAAQSAVIEPGHSFVIRTGAGTAPNNWNEVKPYTWP